MRGNEIRDTVDCIHGFNEKLEFMWVILHWPVSLVNGNEAA